MTEFGQTQIVGGSDRSGSLFRRCLASRLVFISFYQCPGVLTIDYEWARNVLSSIFTYTRKLFNKLAYFPRCNQIFPS